MASAPGRLRKPSRRAYAAGITDEFIPPTVIDDGSGPATIRPGDSAIFFNFRADRGRQLSEALVGEAFGGWERGPRIPGVHLVTMARYEDGLEAEVAFAPMDVTNPLARVVSEAGLAQFHAAETEKYPHVTFFLNGGREEPFPGESRVLIPSPKVATYDLQPEMSAPELTDAVVGAIESGQYHLIVVNYANGDMVGHTGVFAAAVAAIETVDACLARVIAATLEQDGVALVTADHGNAEEMIDRETGAPMTAHTTNPVPVVLVAPDDHPLRHARLRQGGRLSAVAPTLLALMGIAVPDSMTEPALLSQAIGGLSPIHRDSIQARRSCVTSSCASRVGSGRNAPLRQQARAIGDRGFDADLVPRRDEERFVPGTGADRGADDLAAIDERRVGAEDALRFFVLADEPALGAADGRSIQEQSEVGREPEAGGDGHSLDRRRGRRPARP